MARKRRRNPGRIREALDSADTAADEVAITMREIADLIDAIQEGRFRIEMKTSVALPPVFTFRMLFDAEESK